MEDYKLNFHYIPPELDIFVGSYGLISFKRKDSPYEMQVKLNVFSSINSTCWFRLGVDPILSVWPSLGIYSVGEYAQIHGFCINKLVNGGTSPIAKRENRET
jgi:hypothetical protein